MSAFISARAADPATGANPATARPDPPVSCPTLNGRVDPLQKSGKILYTCVASSDARDCAERAHRSRRASVLVVDDIPDAIGHFLEADILPLERLGEEGAAATCSLNVPTALTRRTSMCAGYSGARCARDRAGATGVQQRGAACDRQCLRAAARCCSAGERHRSGAVARGGSPRPAAWSPVSARDASVRACPSPADSPARIR